MISTSPTRQALAVWPLFLAIGLLMLGNGLQSSLIGFRADLEGFATVTVGVVMTGYFAGFLVGSLTTPLFVSRVGHIRVYAGLASLASVATLAHLLVVHPAAWLFFRTITGACLAGLYIVAESWLNGSTTPQTRGRLLSIYMVIVTAGLAGGQLLLASADPAGFVLFVLASLLVSLAVVPIALVSYRAPEVPGLGPIPYRYIRRTAPIGLIGALVTGASSGALLGMGAVWGSAAGLPVPRIATMLTLALVGAVTIQLPLGALSDRYSRRRIIFITTTVATVLAIWMGVIDARSPVALVAIFLLGGSSFPMYSLSGSHVNDLVGPELAMGASSAIMLANGAGAVLGPVGASLVMAAVGPEGLWLYIGSVHGALALYAAWRLAKKWNIPAPFKRPYVPYPARSGGLRAWTTEHHQDDPARLSQQD